MNLVTTGKNSCRRPARIVDVDQAELAFSRHARRYHGYDVGLYAGLQDEWHDQIRTVNWRTYLGPSFVNRLGGPGALLPGAQTGVTFATIGDTIRLQAGATPQEADKNRLDTPWPYLEVDRIVRPVRASGVSLEPSFSLATGRDWLNRFATAAHLPDGRP